MCEPLTVIFSQEGVGWEISTVILGNQEGAIIDSQKQQMHPIYRKKLQDRALSEIFLEIVSSRSLKISSTVNQKWHLILAQVLVIISGKSLALSRKLFPVVVFTGAARPDRSAQVVVTNSLPSNSTVVDIFSTLFSTFADIFRHLVMVLFFLGGPTICLLLTFCVFFSAPYGCQFIPAFLSESN